MSLIARRLALASICTASFAPVALGIGPDITHRDLTDAAHYGPVDMIHGYAWGSATCNIGDTSLAWINGGTPALAMNAYRLYNGRLQQIGVGFCKHACCVANGTGCGLTCGGGFGLRPGCQDVYGAGFNGGQTNLGPRSGINPYTGAFSPIASGSGNATWRRVQIHEKEMSGSSYAGAQYFAEGLYVCTEENPTAKLNNATYRRMTVANSGTSPTYVWSTNGASQTGIPAIQAWRDHGLGANTPDPSVTIVTADVPGEGRFYGASKVTALAGGRYLYDYAVFNLTSDRAGGSVTIPLAAGLQVTSPGFFGVVWHSGEVWTSAPWTRIRESDSLRWQSPQTFAQNPNANAIRWGTMYNYWFTTNVAPAATTGSITLGLFKPSATGPASIQIAGLQIPGLPRCIADFDNGLGTGTPDGGVTVEDLLYYLGVYSEGVTRADITGDSSVTIDDLLLYVDHFESGC